MHLFLWRYDLRFAKQGLCIVSNLDEKSYHVMRRIFVVINGDWLTVAPVGFTGSHIEWLESVQAPEISAIIANHPRGYFMPSRNELGLYIGADFRPLDMKNINKIQTVARTFINEFGLDRHTMVLNGFRPGIPGTIWSPIQRLRFEQVFGKIL